MSRHGNDRGVEPRDFVIAACLFGLCLVAISSSGARQGSGSGTAAHRIRRAGADRPSGPTSSLRPASRQECQWERQPGPELRPGVSAVGPIITPEGHGPEGPPALDPKVQVVRFQGPAGLRVEVLAPEPSPVPIGDGDGHRHGRPRARSRLPPAADATSPSVPESNSFP